MDYISEIKEIKKEFKNAKKTYDTLLKIYSDVEEWIYATWDLFPIEPYYIEKNKFPKGRRIKNPDKKYKVKHGLDKNGKCIITKRNKTLPEQFDEIFFIYKDNSVRSYHFEHTHELSPVNVIDYIFEKGKVVKKLTFASMGNSVKVYHYEGDLLKTETVFNPEKEKDFSKINENVITYDHDEKGLLSIKTKYYYKYYRVSSKEFKELLETGKTELYNNIRTALSELQGKIIYRIAVLYEEGFCFPPEIRICYADRNYNPDKKSASSIEELRHLPAEWDDELKYKSTDILMNKLNNMSLLSSAKLKQLTNMIADVAYKLNLEIDAIIRKELRSDEFIIIHSDFDGAAIKKNIKQMSERLNVLKNTGCNYADEVKHKKYN